MRDLKPPFQFDFSALLQQAQRTFQKRVDGISISLPFISFSVRPDDHEKQVAREIVIRLADRRVLNAFECCDNCIDQALSSLQEIRAFLVDKQVDLADLTDGALYLLIEFMRGAIRQFLTFEQQLQDREGHSRERAAQERYFAGLEALRGHLYRCLIQVSELADLEIPNISEQMRYDAVWALDAYRQPSLPED